MKRKRSGPGGRNTRGRYQSEAIPREAATLRPLSPVCRRTRPPERRTDTMKQPRVWSSGSSARGTRYASCMRLGAARLIRAGLASGQDPAHRFRQVRECGPPGTGAGPPGDVRTPGFHALLQDDRERTVRARTQAGCGRSRTLKRIAEVLRRREHYDLHEVARWLGRVVNGWLNYYALPTSARFLRSFTYIVKRIWLKALRRRAYHDRFSRRRQQALVDRC